MKKSIFILGLLSASIFGVQAQGNDTLAKVKADGAITMGVRDSSGSLSYALGDGKYAGFHVEVCQRIIANVEKAVGKKLEVKYQSVTSQNRIPLVQNGTVDIECGSTTNNATPEGCVFRGDYLCGRSAHCREGQLRHHFHRPAGWPQCGYHHRYHFGANPAQA
jgi:ABC-type amino acid transport substrate-binding protein